MLIAMQVKLIDKYKFAKVTMKEAFETFVMHIAAPKTPSKMTIHLYQATQISQEPA